MGCKIQIRISTENKERMDKRKNYDAESYDGVLTRVLNKLDKEDYNNGKQ